MTRRKTLSLSWVVASAAMLALVGCDRSDRQQERGREHDVIWFVHATDPHIFLDTAHAEATAATGTKQQDLSQNALEDMLKRISSLHASDAPPAFLVLTGDFGVEPCSIAKSSNSAENCAQTFDKATRTQQIAKTAELLGESPVRDIYLVAGNNDIALEDPADPAFGYFNTYIDAVQAEIDKNQKNVLLHNLTRCYATSGGPPEGCYADIGHTKYRLIGFPSQSFKNRDGEDKLTANAPVQEAQLNKFSDLLKTAQQDGKKVLIVTHVPEMDDPYFLAVSRYQAPEKAKDGKAPPPPWVSTWHVSQKLLDGWRDALASDSVIGVLAGHLHDSHKEIYRQPYTWSSDNDHRMGFRKLFLAPPLSVKNQDASPIQARGFALVRLEDGKLEPRLYWYNSETREFSPDPEPRFEQPKHHEWHWALSLMWLWELGAQIGMLERMAVLLIAFLTAFLTVMAVWQIPPSDNPLANVAGKTPDAASAPPAPDASPFATRFGKTVVAGLGGLVVTEVTKALGNQQPSPDTKWFYIVWFILFFFVMLLVLGAFRAFTEGLRARIAIAHSPLSRTSRKTASTFARFWDGFSYWFLRLVHWLFSLRVPLLTFLDTFTNLIQGKNQAMTRVFADQIIDQQRNVVRTTDSIRQDLNDLLERRMLQLRYTPGAPSAAPPALPAPVAAVQLQPPPAPVAAPPATPPAPPAPGAAVQLQPPPAPVAAPPATSAPPPFLSTLPHRVRVNISVLSADQSNVFYISRAPGSSVLTFPKSSVAWVSVFTGEIRWYKSTYPQKIANYDKTVLFNNTDGTIAGARDTILLKDNYQQRHQDYNAFVILPVPWPQRGFGSGYVKGAIHISFRDDQDFALIWKDPAIDPAGDPSPTYPTPQRMLEDWCSDDEVRGALRSAIAALSELLRGFNEVIYQSYLDPNRSV